MKSTLISKILILSSFILSVNFLYAEGDTGDADQEIGTPRPPLPPATDVSGDNNDSDQEEDKVPIDMYTSILFASGVGIIASYTYFARRRKENIL